MPVSLAQSHKYCRDLSRRTAQNFGFAFLTLPPHQRQAMRVLYAFLRLTDDLADDPALPVEVRRQQLDEWRGVILALPRGVVGEHPVWPALAELLVQHQIEVSLLLDVVRGVETDLAPAPFETFADLADYCYSVAGAVGRCCIRVWGYQDRRADGLAVDCGIAFQLTNILRDVAEDAAMGRVYLPLEDLRRFGCTPEDLVSGPTEAQRALLAFEAHRTRQYYRRAEQLFDCLDRPGRRILRAMVDIYSGLLREMEVRRFDVFTERVRLSRWTKLYISGQAWLWPDKRPIHEEAETPSRSATSGRYPLP